MTHDLAAEAAWVMASTTLPALKGHLVILLSLFSRMVMVGTSLH